MSIVKIHSGTARHRWIELINENIGYREIISLSKANITTPRNGVAMESPAAPANLSMEHNY